MRTMPNECISRFEVIDYMLLGIYMNYAQQIIEGRVKGLDFMAHPLYTYISA
jgi:hypothetical protein